MKKQNLILVLGILFSLGLVSAISINIDMKESFDAGEEIFLEYTITSTQVQEIEYAAFVNCPDAPLALLDIKTTSLEANVPLTEKYVYMSSVSEDIEPQTCNATVGVLEPETLEQKTFSIVTNPSFDFNIELDKKVFVKGEEIDISFVSQVSPLVTVTLTYPDDKSEQLSLPATISAEQVGTYNLEITASKSGYKTINKKVQFAVIERAAEIDYIVFGGEKERRSQSRYLFFILIGMIFILIIFVSMIIFMRVMKKRKRLGKTGAGVERKLKRGLKKKEKVIKKKERKLFRGLFRRKKKLPQGKKTEIDKKVRQEKKALTRQKVGVRKEFAKRLGKEKKVERKKEERSRGQEKKIKIRRLLVRGRRQLSMGNRLGAKYTYRKIRMIHRTLKPGEKNRDLYNQLLTFHGRLMKKKEKK